MSFFRASIEILAKDLRLEFRTRESITSVLTFAFLVIVIFNFIFPRENMQNEALLAGIFWVTLTFAGVLGFARSFAREVDEGTLEGLLLLPISRGAIFLGKVIFNIFLLIIIELFTFPFMMLFYNFFPPGNLLVFLGIVILVDLGFALIGTLEGAISTKARARELLLPLLFFPIVIPLFLGGVRSTLAIWQGEKFSSWFLLIVLFDLFYFFLTLLLFDYTVEE